MVKKEWIVMHCINAFRDADGNKGEHKVPVAGYDLSMTKEEALNALHEIEQAQPKKDFSIRRIRALPLHSRSPM